MRVLPDHRAKGNDPGTSRSPYRASRAGKSGAGHSPKIRNRLLSERSFDVLGYLALQDLLVSAAVPLGVEQHEVTTCSAFDAYREGQVSLAIVPEGKRIALWGKPAIDQERRKVAHGK